MYYKNKYDVKYKKKYIEKYVPILASFQITIILPKLSSKGSVTLV